jgi:hypothetical protein
VGRSCANRYRPMNVAQLGDVRGCLPKVNELRLRLRAVSPMAHAVRHPRTQGYQAHRRRTIEARRINRRCSNFSQNRRQRMASSEQLPAYAGARQSIARPLHPVSPHGTIVATSLCSWRQPEQLPKVNEAKDGSLPQRAGSLVNGFMRLRSLGGVG